MKGKLRVEKQVDVSRSNYWPTQTRDRGEWCERTIKNRVLYNIEDVEPFTVIGAYECSLNKRWPVQIVGAQNDTHLYMLAWKDAHRSKFITRALSSVI